MDMVSPMGIELRQAKERIQFLENELRQITRGSEYKPENVKEEKRVQNPKEEDDIGKLQKRNRELIERIVYLEKAQETSLNNKNNAKPNLSHDQNTIEVLEKERNIYKVILISFFLIPNV